jgi:hypothetical protein
LFLGQRKQYKMYVVVQHNTSIINLTNNPSCLSAKTNPFATRHIMNNVVAFIERATEDPSMVIIIENSLTYWMFAMLVS